ncbi:MAG: vitamin B12-dependent ribonucleotide reductase, partial [Myxococcota bacterium]
MRVQAGRAETSRAGLSLTRRWTTAGIDPFDQVTWEKRSAVITGDKGQVVFEQTDIEVPSSWSQLATNVVVSKYFHGALGTPTREVSVRQLISRVVDTISGWADVGSYFARQADLETF